MNKHDQLMEVYRHKNTGYVPCFFTDIDFSKPREINERPENEDGYDWFGVHWTDVPSAGAPMVTPGFILCDDVTKWREQIKFPNLSQYDWESLAKESTKDWDRENKLSLMMIINGIFERTHALLGFEGALAAMIEEPEAYQELVDAIADYKIELVGIIGRYYKPDVLDMHDDFGANDRMLMSPDMWRRFFKEPTRRLIRAVHDQGIIYQHHSCGYIEPIVDELVELGIDALDPLQITNDWRKIKDKYQHRVTFVGGFDTQGVYDNPDATEEEMRAELRRTYDLLAPGGSFVAFPLTVTFNFVPVFIDEHFKNAFNYGGR